jgi:hypothetical protein
MMAGLTTTNLLAKPLTLNEISEAGCRIDVSHNLLGTIKHEIGSGICIKEDTNNIYILTNGHVLNTANNALVEFFRCGCVSQKLNAKVIYKAYRLNTDIDFCILSLPKTSFGQYPLPRVIPLAPKNYIPKTGYYIASAGCPQGRDLIMWQGYVSLATSSRLLFTPAPLPGQSGSGLLVQIQDSNGEWHTRVGGVVTWRILKQIKDIVTLNREDRYTGGAIPISRLYDILANNNNVQPTKMPISYSHISYNKPCKYCGKMPSEHALGSDGKLKEMLI